VWKALSRQPEWIGWALAGCGVAWLIAAIRK
jgi:hypothetical protein